MHSSVGMQLISIKAMLSFFLQEAEDVWQITVHLALKQTLHFPMPHCRVELIYKGSLLNSYSIVEKKIDRSSFT